MRNRADVAANHMPLRTRVFTTVLDRFARDSIVGMDLDGIRRSRASVPATVPPFTWITGPVFGDVTRENASFPARDGHEVPLRVYRPPGSHDLLPVVAFFHGGGWVLGNTRRYDPLCTFLARAVEVVVVSVDYRMAPELDPLPDEGRLYAERLAAAGVSVRHTNYVGAPHGFANFPGATTIGRQHRAELVSELHRHLHS